VLRKRSLGDGLFGFIGGAFSNVLTLIFLPVIKPYNMLVDDGRLLASAAQAGAPARSPQHF